LEAVTQDGAALEFADKRCRSDREIVLKAVLQFPDAIDFSDKRFRSDREIVLAAEGPDAMLEFALS